MGSHILDSLQERQLPTAILLRDSSPKGFLNAHLQRVEVRTGSIEVPATLPKALEGITHLIHCAGRTKAVNPGQFYQTNHLGTRNLIEAMDKGGNQVERFVHISSLAVTGPATPDNPAQENSPARPVSDYGKSKWAAEEEVRQRCGVPFTILRPPAVYGPRDTGFLSMFKAIERHVLPRPRKSQALSLVYVEDLAKAVALCLLNPVAAGKTYFVASPETVTTRKMAEEIAVQMNRWTVPLPMPGPLLWMVCLLQQLMSQLTGRASLLNLQKYAELCAPGWVCSPLKLQKETGFVCGTQFSQGIRQTLDWYQQEHWL